MKVVGIREAKQNLSEFIDQAQDERILITRHGKPAAVVIGVAGEELEDVLLQMDPKFWKMIEHRRKNSSTIPLEDVLKRYDLAPKQTASMARDKPRAKSKRAGNTAHRQSARRGQRAPR